jgi:hypothetical protein
MPTFYITKCRSFTIKASTIERARISASKRTEAIEDYDIVSTVLNGNTLETKTFNNKLKHIHQQTSYNISQLQQTT